jgi:hypothetical protein
MRAISRDPRREEYTICTAVAPDAVFTVRTYGTRQLHDPGLVHKSSSHKPGTCRSQRRASPESRIVSQLRIHYEGSACLARSPPHPHLPQANGRVQQVHHRCSPAAWARVVADDRMDLPAQAQGPPAARRSPSSPGSCHGSLDPGPPQRWAAGLNEHLHGLSPELQAKFRRLMVMAGSDQPGRGRRGGEPGATRRPPGGRSA